MRRSAVLLLSSFFLVPAVGTSGQVPAESGLSGTFRPSAPPEVAARNRVGSGCVVDLKQAYAVEGSLVGEMKVDFRIFVAGDCAKPPGSADEHWISYGTFVVRARGNEYEGTLIYLATVKAGGNVQGTLTLDGGLSAELEVDGVFANGYLSYSGEQDGSTDG